MRAFAEFVMRGRLQATAVCVGFAIVPFLHWLGTAVVGLVFLRRGAAEGAMLLLWASLPLVGWYTINQDASPLLVLAGASILAWVLRETISWETTLGVAVVMAALLSLVFEFVSADVLALLVEWYLELVNTAAEQRLTEDQAHQVLVGFFAMGQAYAMILALVLARWWQSLLYNPGGFQREFHRIRLSPMLSMGLVGTIVLFFVLNDPAFGRWIPLLTVPLVVSGVSIVHWVVAKRALSGGWLVMFYLLLVFLIQLAYPLLVSVALLDSWMNLRQRFARDRSGDDGPNDQGQDDDEEV